MTIDLQPYVPHPILSPFYASTLDGLPESMLPDCLEHLEVLDQQLAAVDQEYIRLKSELGVVEARQKVLRGERASCSSLTAPIRRLPEELLTSIFMHVITRPRGAPHQRDFKRLTRLQLVCWKWYQSTFALRDSESFRQGLVIDYPQTPPNWRSVSERLNLWLKRAPRKGPLTLVVSKPSNDDFEFLHVNDSGSHSEDWNSDDDDQLYQSLLEDAQSEAEDVACILSQRRPWTRLEFTSEYDNIPSEDGMPYTILRPIFAAVRAEMKESGTSPWVSVTRFVARGHSAEPFPIADVPLQALPNLEELQLMHMEFPIQTLSHPRLQVLTLGSCRPKTEFNLSATLDNLPALRKLVITSIELDRSRKRHAISTYPLLELELHQICPSTGERLLSTVSFPNLQKLTLRAWNFASYPRAASEKPSDSQSPAAPIPPFKALARIISDAGPTLKELEFDQMSDLPTSKLRRFISSAPNITRLCAPSIAFLNKWNPESENKLKNLVDLEIQRSPTEEQMAQMLAFFEYRRGFIGDDGALLPRMRVHVTGGWARRLVKKGGWAARFAEIGIRMTTDIALKTKPKK